MNPEFTIPELTEVVARLAALLGPREGTVVQLEGGITNRNFRVNFGGHDYVVRLPGKRTALLGIDLTDLSPPLSGHNVFRRFLERIRSGAWWRELLYLLFHSVLEVPL